MLVSHTHRFCYIHVPKTAGSSMTWALVPYLAISPRFKRQAEAMAKVQRKGWQMRCHYRAGMSLHTGKNSDRYKILPEVREKQYFVFSVVRNPWDRFASLGRSQRAGDGRNPRSCWNFLAGGGKPPRTFWFNPQSWWIPGDAFVLHFESLDEDWAKLCDILKLEKKPFPVTNRHSFSNPDYRELYGDDKELIRLVGEKYAADVERFGYEF